MTPRFHLGAGSKGVLFGPLLVGLAYGLAQHLVREGNWEFLYWQSPFVFTVLSGVAIAFACRPVLARIGWSRGAAASVAVGLLLGAGQMGDWLAASLTVAAGLGSFPINLPESGLSFFLAAGVAGTLMALLFRPPGGAIDARDLWARLRYRSWRTVLVRLVLLAAATVVLWLGIAWADAYLEESATTLYVLLVEPNPWQRLGGLWLPGGAHSRWVGATLFLAILWLRAALAIAPLIPVALAIRGSWGQLTLVFAVLLFVLGEFAPIMVDQPYASLNWLLTRTLLGLARACVLGGAAAALFGLIRESGAPRQEA